MFTAKIIDSKRDTIQATQEPFLDVEVEISNAEGEVVEVRKLGFPADTSKKEIHAEVSRFLRVYEDDYVRGLENAEADALNEKAEATAKSLVDDKEIKPAKKAK